MVAKDKTKVEKAAPAIDKCEQWLLNFERSAGGPIILTLLIEDQQVCFVSSVVKEIYFNEQKEGEGLELPGVQSKFKPLSSLSGVKPKDNYFG